MTALDSKITKDRSIKFRTHSLSKDCWISIKRSSWFLLLTRATSARQELISYQNLFATCIEALRPLKISRMVAAWLLTGQRQTIQLKTTTRKSVKWSNSKMKTGSFSVKRKDFSWTSWCSKRESFCSSRQEEEARPNSKQLNPSEQYWRL